MNINLKIWRQKSNTNEGKLHNYRLENVDPNISFLEMLDILNNKLIKEQKDPVAFDHDCREGICGSCGFMINGRPHGPQKATTVCQLHMRSFNDEDDILLEPFRAKSFGVIKDLSVDRQSFDRIISSAGFVSVDTGEGGEANKISIDKSSADEAFLSAACIGCGACVAACKNSSAMLFTSAKISHLALLPQGEKEKTERVNKMVATMDAEGFGACTNTGACSAECPKEIGQINIARLNREFIKAQVSNLFEKK
ncbi:MAG: succinate dehydrogenase/fumarate reductase iron-sulfur subunit [Fidelibacterota bacterium]|jgi:succinate dehydrogenase / fumarate reductase iron-sulfur subunit|tara:strand:+ start:330 stop:1088 length:759 start_codon:yes stop_codon:yes gene_type:complete